MTNPSARPSASSWLLFAAWFAVGAPLLWGVAQTVHKALALFG
jgi:hypothetical protein